MKNIQTDFRVAFARMADQAIVTRDELAELLGTTPAGLSQMNYRGELPTTAFPEKRKACWFARDIRAWLDAAAEARTNVSSILSAPNTIRRGRPRMPTSETGE